MGESYFCSSSSQTNFNYTFHQEFSSRVKNPIFPFVKNLSSAESFFLRDYIPGEVWEKKKNYSLSKQKENKEFRE